MKEDEDLIFGLRFTNDLFFEVTFGIIAIGAGVILQFLVKTELPWYVLCYTLGIGLIVSSVVLQWCWGNRSLSGFKLVTAGVLFSAISTLPVVWYFNYGAHKDELIQAIGHSVEQLLVRANPMLKGLIDRAERLADTQSRASDQ